MTHLDDRIELARDDRRNNIEKFKNIKFEDRKASGTESCQFNHPYYEEIADFLLKFKENYDKYNKLFMRLKIEGKIKLEDIQVRKIKMSEILGMEEGSRKDYTQQIPTAFQQLKEINLFHKVFFEDQDIDDSLSQQVDFFTTHYEIEYLPLAQTRYFYIDNPQSLAKMIEEINSHAQEIAVDLEHHSIESYLGITCLMQISTRFTDYIIDTLRLRSHLQELNLVFCNPKIVKVLHGADFDIEWLQKDFGIYVVNMFDTGQAARVLSLSSYSLANLLASICGVNANKQYQQADWRQRPLSNEMIKYAREDTHYLLLIYDNLRFKLLQRALERSVLPLYNYNLVINKSIEISCKVYSKPEVKSQEYYQLKARNVASLSKLQFSVMKLLFKYRDYAARKLDISPHHVLSNKLMFQIVKLPRYDITSIYIIVTQHSLFKNFVPEFVKSVDTKLARNNDKIDKNSSKILESNYLENMREKFNKSKKAVENLKNVSTVVNKEKIDIKSLTGSIKIEIGQIKNKTPSKMFVNELITINIQKPAETNFQNDYKEILDKLDSFNIVSFIRDKYNIKNIQIVNPVKNSSKKDESQISKPNATPQLNDEERYLKQKRAREDYIDLTENKKIHKENLSETESEDDDEIININNTNINNYLDRVKDFQKNLNEMKTQNKPIPHHKYKNKK
jgi:ribonuclease D